ncbi:MAG: hypothetical protein VCB42_01575 [Myxococcota bacterium]
MKVVDGDGHVLEPANLWLDYAEARHRDRVPFDELPAGALSLLGTMGDPNAQAGPDRRYTETMPLGACDLAERIERLDQQGLDAAVLYTTLGIIWEISTRDVELADAMSRAYNRWIADFCQDSGGRLVTIAHLSLIDPNRAAAELERAVADGCRGATFLPWNWNRIPHGDLLRAG